ncbi:alpha/beta hydrolase, partial [Pseudomonas syringae]|uniref:alpha/beta hydrolase n=1 Tax=Pseudomonas syringae TaxID=317 RepID=UPI0021806353
MKLLGIFTLVLALTGCSSMLFYPEQGVPFTPDKARLQYQDVNLTAADGTRLHGWWLPAKEGVPVKGTVLHLHGNGGNLSWHLGGVWWLPEQGYQVLMLDYRGYGESQGEPSR